MGKISHGMTSGVMFSGNTLFFGLGDLLQLIGSHGSTGVLKILSKYTSEAGEIYFSSGNPIDAVCGEKTGSDALYALFGWTHGDFYFEVKNIPNRRTIHESRMQLILNGLKMLDEGQIEKLGPITNDEETASDSLVMGIPQALVKGPLIDYIYVVDEEEFSPGNEIVVEGRHGSWIWGILEGNVQIAKESSQGRVNILRVGRGSFVGSITSFLLGGSVRSATAIAKDRVLLGVLDSHRLAMEFGSMPAELKSIFISLDKRLKEVTQLAVDYYFNNDPIPACKQLGMTLVEDINQEKCYTIKQGRAWIIRKMQGTEILIANLYPGDFLGQVPFLDINPDPLTTFIYGSANLVLEENNSDQILGKYIKLSPMFKNIIDNTAAYITATTGMVCGFKIKHLTNRIYKQS
jgi:hypothetical protein